MTELSGKNFGLLIAYVLPGFVLLYGLQPVSSAINGWLSVSPTIPASIESLFFVTVASTAAGMTVSAVRWLLIDSLHHVTGLRRPVWDDAKLQQNIDAFDAIVEAHYRYYQFYANTLIALPILFAVALATKQAWARTPLPLAAFGVIEITFLAMSRDTLRKYYRRTSRLLGTSPQPKERRKIMGNGHGKPPKADKPTGKPKKPASRRK
ncbi:MAG: hypothetical protein JNM18_09685 [Planctomycetaceae bacterium]|nr:hypothetical protein [Planctomycetaceae bacterium]